MEEAEREIDSSYEATEWHKLEDATRKAYAGALYEYLRYSWINGFMAPREALKGRMLQVATDCQYESPIKAYCPDYGWRRKRPSYRQSWYKRTGCSPSHWRDSGY